MTVQTAAAQAPGERVYGGPGADVEGQLGQAAGGGVLPFTGLDLALVFGGAAALVFLGLLVRRVNRAES